MINRRQFTGISAFAALAARSLLSADVPTAAPRAAVRDAAARMLRPDVFVAGAGPAGFVAAIAAACRPSEDLRQLDFAAIAQKVQLPHR